MFFDMDGTLVDYPNEPFHSSWDALLGALPGNLKEQWIKLRDFYYPRKELCEEWYKKQVALLKGIRLSDMNRYLFPVPYSLGVREFFSSRNGYVTGIISAGVGLVAERVAKELGLYFVISNPIEVMEGIFTGRGELKSHLWRKDVDVLRIAKENNLSLQKMLYVGDNENDNSVFDLVGVSVAFCPRKKTTEERADFVIRDFRELNDILEKIEK